MCEWVVERLGPDVPIHFSRFYPTTIAEPSGDADEDTRKEPRDRTKDRDSVCVYRERAGARVREHVLPGVRCEGDQAIWICVVEPAEVGSVSRLRIHDCGGVVRGIGAVVVEASQSEAPHLRNARSTSVIGIPRHGRRTMPVASAPTAAPR